MQVLRVCAFCAFSAPPAFPPCYCSLAFRHQVRRLTSRISSESYPGNQERVANYHGAEEFTCVHHTAHPAPSPPDAGRDTVPSRFRCQSGDCGYVVRGHWTARYLAAVPRRILSMEQQVWSIQLARQSPLRPRVAVPSPHGTFQEHAAHIAKWPAMLSSKGSRGTCIPRGLSTFLPCACTAHIDHPVGRVPEAPHVHRALTVGTPQGIAPRALLVPLPVGQPSDELHRTLDDPLHLGQGGLNRPLHLGKRLGRLHRIGRAHV